MLLGPLQNTAPLYTRSPFQVALLMYLTLGLYIFFWAYKVRRWCEVTLERPNQSTWKTIAMIVPIFNLFLLFELAQMIKGAAFRAGTGVNNALPMLSLVTFGCYIAGRLPEPYFIAGVFIFVPIALMTLPFERAQLAIHGSIALPGRFHWSEWTLIVLGGAFWILILIGLGSDLALIQTVLVVTCMGYLKIKSDRLVNEARQA